MMLNSFILAEAELSAFAKVEQFIDQGGWFMVAILCCLLVTIAATVFKFVTLGHSLIMPKHLAHQIDRVHAGDKMENEAQLMAEFQQGDTALARLCFVASHNAKRGQDEAKTAIQSAAREEVVKMNAGMPIFDVIITIAPLLGLLGTVSGLIFVFARIGPDADHAEIAHGISMALNTTVAGLVVAVPTVIAQSHFSRKIETMTARMEVLMSKVVLSISSARESQPAQPSKASKPAKKARK